MHELIRRFLQGVAQGADRARNINTDLLDQATGDTLYRNRSHGDDHARLLQTHLPEPTRPLDPPSQPPADRRQ